MDKLSVKVLKYLKKEGKPIHINAIVEKYGQESASSLAYLATEKYVKEGQRISGVTGHGNNRTLQYKTNLTFSIAPLGKDFLQHRFWNTFDQWVTRIAAIVGAITGITSLVLHFCGA